jgi:hypothetical protein
MKNERTRLPVPEFWIITFPLPPVATVKSNFTIRENGTRMSIRSKISLLAAALLVLMAVVGGVALDGLTRVHDELKSLHVNILPLDVMLEDLAQQEIEREAELYALLRNGAATGTYAQDTLAPLLKAEAKAISEVVNVVADHHVAIGHPEISEVLGPPARDLILNGTAFAASAEALAAAMSNINDVAIDAAFVTFTENGAKVRTSLAAYPFWSGIPRCGAWV